MPVWPSTRIDRWPRIPEERVPRVVTGTFFVLLGLLAVETIRFPLLGDSFTPEFYIGILTSLPFILLTGYAGQWLTRTTIPADRQDRILLWFFGGLVVFLAINLAIMPVFPRRVAYEYVAWARWAAAIGGGVGVLIGLFEARAIDRELIAERERVKSEELEAQNDRLDEFAAILSHDLRNPLNVASGNIDLAKRDHESDHLDAAATALSRMDEIIEETLLLARSGRVIGETEPVTLETFVGDCWQNVDTGAASLRVDDPPTVSADTDRLRHLMENLFRNSVEHGSTDNRDASRLDNSVQHGGEAVTIRVGACPGGFFVEDDGPGFPEADRQSIFTAGFSTASDGNGFGLAIVQQIAEAHGWTTSISESETGGARFEFTDVDRSA